jgi:outer membrane protein
MSGRQLRRLWATVLYLVAGLYANSAPASELVDLEDVPVDQYERKPMREPDFLFGYAGGALIHSERIVGDNRKIDIPLPLFGINYKDVVYWNVTQGGAWFWKSRNRKFKFGPVVKLRPGVNTDNDKQLDGLSKRKGSLEAGVGISWFSFIKTSFKIYQDFSGRSDGLSAQFKASQFIRLNDHISTIPSLAFEWLSDEVVDYYYGVSSGESERTGKTTYHGRHTVNTRAGLTVADHITTHWAVLGGAMYRRYGKGITDSPIVTKKANAVLYLGVTYIFLKI